ncbi:hypothetical protein ACEWY4_020847 [Coilia grayii]|uniref:Chemokine interleukin-8-like domain-containing protein n=1 Tax=Coilia grayii TaxID=363190 RepID=A0ABD1J7A3_9TELE
MQLIHSSVGVLLPLTVMLFLDKGPGVCGTFVPGRCQCPASMPRTPQRPLDFTVLPRNAHCHTAEIMVKLRGHDRLLCLSPSGKQGKRLIRCWRRVSREGRDRRQCLRTPKNPKNRHNPKNRRRQTRRQKERRQ